MLVVSIFVEHVCSLYVDMYGFIVNTTLTCMNDLCCVIYVCCFIFESVHKATAIFAKNKFENKQKIPKLLFWQRVLTALPSVQGHVNPKPYGEVDGIAVGVSTRNIDPYSEADGFTIGVRLTCELRL